MSSNILSFKRTYNSDVYEFTYIIKNNELSMTSPALINNDKNSALIPSENVVYFKVTNSMTSFIPTAKINIIDIDNAITNRIKANNTRIEVMISKPGGDEMLLFDMTFIVKDYSVQSMRDERIFYSITAELDNAIPLNTLCSYATSCSLDSDNEMMENPYEIIKNILNQVDYKMFPLEKTDEKGNRLQTRYSLPYTNEVCHFITTPNTRAMDAIAYLLSYAVGNSGTNPPAYFIHNLMNGKCFISTMENLFRSTSIQEQPKNTKVPFSITKPIINGKQFNITDVKNMIENGGINEAMMFFNYRFFEFDQETREWENYHINKITLNDLLTKGIDNQAETSIYMNALKEDIEQSKYYAYTPHKHPVFYDVMRNLELYSSNLIFTVDGDLRLDVGQVINVYERGEFDSKVEQFNGQWLITKIEHSFRDKDYKCHLYCSRRFYTDRK